MKKITPFIIFIISFCLNAQNGSYVINKNLDTIYGDVQKVVWNMVRFDRKKYQANDGEIIACYFQKKELMYEAIESPHDWTRPGEAIFMPRLTTDGKIKLFYEKGSSNGQFRIPSKLFISKDGSKLKKLSTGNGFKFIAKKTLNELVPYFQNEEEFQIRLRSVKNKDELILLINDYNKSLLKK